MTIQKYSNILQNVGIFLKGVSSIIVILGIIEYKQKEICKDLIWFNRLILWLIKIPQNACLL
jgi:hypothetical protein